MKKQKGFTLIELMIVIAIVGILAATILVFINSGRQKSKAAAFKAQVNSMRTDALKKCYDTTLTTAAGQPGTVAGPSSGYVGTINIAANSSSYSSNAAAGQNCGPSGLGIFNFSVDSSGITPTCTATVTDTGVTYTC